MYGKLTYILSGIVLLASSCSSDAPDAPLPDGRAELSFEVSGLTRVSVTTSFDRFAVFGDIRFKGDNTIHPVILFKNTEVKHTDNGWQYDGKQYWMPDYEHSFVAVTPLSVLGDENSPSYLNSKLSFTYTIPTASDGALAKNSDVTDILAATHRRLYDENEENKTTTTTFRFTHILSLINITVALTDNIMSPDEFMLCHKMEISGFSTNADFSILPASRQSNNQTDDCVIEISRHEGAGKFAFTPDQPVKVVRDSHASLFASHDAIIMLPQTFADDSKAGIILSYSLNDDSEIKQAFFPLKGQKWETGKSYSYKCTISNKGASFETTSISKWDELDVGNIDAH